MCILSVVKNEGEWVLTFSRDEDPQRSFLQPDWRDSVFCPLDKRSDGTWIGWDGKRIMSIQNGAEQKHIQMPPYDRSRGVILYELLQNGGSPEKSNIIGKLKIEPFTLTEFIPGSDSLKSWSWNGTVLKNNILTCPYLACSSTLYSDSLQNQIRADFSRLTGYGKQDMEKFHFGHRIGSSGSPLTRPATSSIIQFYGDDENTGCSFLDLISGENIKFDLR